MNVQVQEFINKMKEEQKEKELKKREEHLVSLGLIDENKSTYKTSKVFPNEEGWKFDYIKQTYYKETPEAIEVTDEEYQEILKYAPVGAEINEKAKENTKTTWANAINVTATIFIVLNIVGAFILSIEFGWIPIIIALTYCILWYPLIVGFSKIVKVAEKTLQE